MENTQKITICIDPQMQANIWLKKHYQDFGIIVTKQNDSMFAKSVEYAIENGKPLLIEHVGEKLVSELNGLLKKGDSLRVNDN